MRNTNEFEAITVDGKPHWRHLPSGRVLPVLHGGAEGDPPPGGEGDEGEEKTFTQAQLDAKAGQARNEGRRVAARELADQLGCSVEDAVKRLKAADEAAESRKDETTKALEAAAGRESAAAAREAAADRRERLADIKDQLRDAGANKDALGDLTAAVEARLAANPDSDIAAAVDGVKTSMGGLFDPEGEGEEEGEEKPPPPSGRTGGKPPRPKGKQKSLADIGKETAEFMGWEQPANAA